MKYIQILILAILVISCKKDKSNEFSLDVKVNGDYNGYLYLNYNEKKDSSLITNGRAFFNGSVSYPISAYYSTNYMSASENGFYLENEKIETEIAISKKKIKGYNMDWIAINKISGTNSSVIRKDFDEFKNQYSSNRNWNIKLYSKLQEILKQNPKHRYAGDLLSQISYDTILNIKQIGELYKELDVKSQDPFTINLLEAKIFPERIIKIGDSIYDFTLPNKKKSLISSKDYRGQILFIDFWASWCKPCLAQFPELTIIKNDFEEEGVKILGVSIDEKEDDWFKTMDKEKLQWENVIDTLGLSGKLANNYGILAVPYNILVDPKGKVIANDISLERLRKVLDSITSDRKAIANNVSYEKQ